MEVWDEERYVPYMFDGSDWVGYENLRSVIKKVVFLSENLYSYTDNIHVIHMYACIYIETL